MSRSKKEKNVDEGDLIVIDITGGSFIGKVLFASAVFGEVILLAIYPAKVREQEVRLSDLKPSLLLYTSGRCVGPDGWKSIGFEPVTELERQQSRRIVGGEVWLADEEIGPATAADRKTLPRMQVAGCLAVEMRLDELASQGG